jgi:selenocysteine-specific elongation factor
VRTVGGSTEVAGRLIGPGVLEALRTTLVAAVGAAHAADPLAPGLDRQAARTALRAGAAVSDEVIRRAERAGAVEAAGATLRLPGWRPGATAAATDRKATLLALIEGAGAEPPSVAELTAQFGSDAQALLKLLEADRSAVAVASDRWFAATAVRALLGRLRSGVVADRRYTPSELREILGISRKYLIPFLEWCDRRRISHRADAGRSFGEIPEFP